MWQQVWPEEQDPDHRLRHGSLLRAGANTKETQTGKNTAFKIAENRLKGMRVQQKNIQTDET